MARFPVDAKQTKSVQTGSKRRAQRKFPASSRPSTLAAPSGGQWLESSRIPSQYFGNSESPIVSPQEIRTYQEFQRLFGISLRSRQRPDGDIELLGYDLVASPPTPSAILGGEEMSYNTSTWMTLNKKKTRWERVKDYFSSIYKRWRRVG